MTTKVAILLLQTDRLSSVDFLSATCICPSTILVWLDPSDPAPKNRLFLTPQMVGFSHLGPFIF